MINQDPTAPAGEKLIGLADLGAGGRVVRDHSVHIGVKAELAAVFRRVAQRIALAVFVPTADLVLGIAQQGKCLNLQIIVFAQEPLKAC